MRKLPLGECIERLYFKRFGKERPDVVLSIEEEIRRDQEKKARKREEKTHRRQIAMNGAREPERRTQ